MLNGLVKVGTHGERREYKQSGGKNEDGSRFVPVWSVGRSSVHYILIYGGNRSGCSDTSSR